MFEVHIVETVPEYLFLDEVHLRQVLVNLLANVLKFTPKRICLFET
ncbi:MAG: hypothetical protein R3E08_09370 [Thiotrichaceae bacterium]